MSEEIPGHDSLLLDPLWRAGESEADDSEARADDPGSEDWDD